MASTATYPGSWYRTRVRASFNHYGDDLNRVQEKQRQRLRRSLTPRGGPLAGVVVAGRSRSEPRSLSDRATCARVAGVATSTGSWSSHLRSPERWVGGRDRNQPHDFGGQGLVGTGGIPVGEVVAKGLAGTGPARIEMGDGLPGLGLPFEQWQQGRGHDLVLFAQIGSSRSESACSAYQSPSDSFFSSWRCGSLNKVRA